VIAEFPNELAGPEFHVTSQVKLFVLSRNGGVPSDVSEDSVAVILPLLLLVGARLESG